MSITTVMASENLCLPNIGILAEELTAAITPGGAVRLDLSDVAAPDLSVIQLVQAARVSAAKAACDFALTAPAGDPFRALLDRAGFMSADHPDHSQFWFHGDTAQ